MTQHSDAIGGSGSSWTGGLRWLGWLGCLGPGKRGTRDYSADSPTGRCRVFTVWQSCAMHLYVGDSYVCSPPIHPSTPSPGLIILATRSEVG